MELAVLPTGMIDLFSALGSLISSATVPRAPRLFSPDIPDLRRTYLGSV
jgi:hypothetical protein